MNIVKKIIGSELPQAVLAKKGFEASTCSKECDDCTARYPASVKVESGDLFNSTKPYGLHIVVPTGKTDWPHDACGQLGTFEHAVASWGNASSGKFSEIGAIKVTVSSLCTQAQFGDEEYYSGAKGDMLLLPFFVKISGIPQTHVNTILDAYIPCLIHGRAHANSEVPLLPPGLPPVSVSADLNMSHVFLCSHRTRDRRCGVTAPIFKKEMDSHLRDRGLYRDQGDFTPGGVSVSYVNHVGGHKFAANVIIYTRSPLLVIWVARATPANAQPILDECILHQRVWPDTVRLADRFMDIQW